MAKKGGQVPLAVLEKRLARLSSIVKSRQGRHRGATIRGGLGGKKK